MERNLIGMITPSSNTVLEPVTNQLLQDLPEVSAHFDRIRVTEISLSQEALGQFEEERLLQSAGMLADARVDVIGWNGTSSGWLGFESDELLVQKIEQGLGVKACTSVLALNEIFSLTGVTRFGLVTPYHDHVQEKIIANYRKAGFDCVAERHLGLTENFRFSEVSADEIRRMVREVAESKPQAITIFCTNIRGAPLADELEQELGIPIYDTIATVVWKSLKIAGVDCRRLKHAGSLFSSGI